MSLHVKCEKCGGRMVMPPRIVSGVLEVRCPACGSEFEVDTRSPDAYWRPGRLLSTGIGDFVIERVLTGGMGVVLVISDPETTEPMAAKTFKPEYLDSPEVAARFRREALLWIKLDKHPNIVRAHHFQMIEDFPFIFMEYVAGRDLRDEWVGCRRMHPRDVTLYALQVVRALIHMEAMIPGFVHRDIKPENCLITSGRHLKVTDFGLARAATASGGTKVIPAGVRGDGAVYRSSGLHVTGTLPYIAPEIWMGGEPDRAADVYSLGAMMFELLSGEVPFEAEDNTGVRWAYLHTVEPPPPLETDAPEELKDMVLRCLAKKPEERPEPEWLQTRLEEILKRHWNQRLRIVGGRSLQAWEYVNKGASLAALGRLREAWDCYKKALEADPRLGAAYYNVGRLMERMGRPQDAERAYGMAIEVDPDCADAFANRAGLRMKRDDLDGALADLTAALALRPGDWRILANRGVLRSRAGAYEDAIADYTAAMEFKSDDAELFYNRAVAMAKMERYGEAVQDLERFLMLAPGHPQASEVRRLLARWRS